LKAKKQWHIILEMNFKLKHRLWDFVRPFHSPLTCALRRRLGGNYQNHPEMELPPPFEAVQLDVERHLHQYLHVKPEAVGQIVIVGANDASEVDRMRQVYSKARFLCFEPNPKTYHNLEGKFRGVSSVALSNHALGRSLGTARFYEMSMAGNGSLLEPDAEAWATANKQTDKNVSSYEVQVSTLDRETAMLPAIDLLWMDVQGAEGEVLAGGAEALKRTKSIMIEVALVRSPYKGALLFPEINELLKANNFMCVGLGVDAWNGTGNAFFVSAFDQLICR
jgi:2-O-methyltransferase